MSLHSIVPAKISSKKAKTTSNIFSLTASSIRIAILTALVTYGRVKDKISKLSSNKEPFGFQALVTLSKAAGN